MIPKPFRILGYLTVVALLFSCSPKPENSDDHSTKFQQYYVQGQVLYQQYCSNCHQANGKGLGRLYPPVDQSDFMENNFDEVICTIKYGKQGILIVNGDDYNMEMRGNPGLTELEIAEIVTYIYNTWTHKKGLVDVNDVSRILANCVH